MSEDAFASDYGVPCPLCEEDSCRPYVGLKGSEEMIKEREELKIDQNGSNWLKKDASVCNNIKESGLNEKRMQDAQVVDEMQGTKVDIDSDIYDCGEVEEEEEEETDEQKKAEKSKEEEDNTDNGKENDGSGDLVPLSLEDKNVLQLTSDCPMNLVMVCEESVERHVSKELMLCPSKSLVFPTFGSPSPPPPSQNPLPLPLPPSIPSLLPIQSQTVARTQAPASMAASEALCLGKRKYDGSPPTDPKTLIPPGQVEVTARQVYTTRQYTRFTSRPASLLPVPSHLHTETSSQSLPHLTNTSILPPPPRKKTRTSYSSDQLEELERVFQEDHYPDGEKRKEIAISIGVTPQRVMVWFQNRRAKLRKSSKMTVKKHPTKPPGPAQAPAPAPAPPSVPLAVPAYARGSAQASSSGPVYRPTHLGPVIAPIPSQTGNTLPPYSTFLSSCTSPPGCVNASTACISQGSSMEYMPPLMQSPPPLRRASLPFFAAYNPPTHTLSVLLDTPEHSEPQLLSLHSNTVFDRPGNSTQNFPLSTYPQQTATLMPHQPNSFLPQQSINILQQQPGSFLPRYSCLSYLTPSPYLTPNSSEDTTTTAAPQLPLNQGTGSSMQACSTAGHSHYQYTNSRQTVLQPGVQALQAFPWAGDVYGNSAQFQRTIPKLHFSSQGCERPCPPSLPSHQYITPQRVSCPNLPKPAVADSVLPSVKSEAADTEANQLPRVSDAETIFHCDFSPVHF